MRYGCWFLPAAFSTDKPLFCDYSYITVSFMRRCEVWVERYGLSPLDDEDWREFTAMFWF